MADLAVRSAVLWRVECIYIYTVSLSCFLYFRLSPADLKQVKKDRERRYLVFKPKTSRDESLDPNDVLPMWRKTDEWKKDRFSPMTVPTYAKICRDICASLNDEAGSFDLDEDSLWKLFTIGFRVNVLTRVTEDLEVEGCDICEEMDCICSKYNSDFMRVIE